ncbi:hypothetical protein [Streptomyces umbrinus]|uniref:hypothetical protein n=1 Tax=Streptomyces umbrinus TaxID=67370 RepID=UPI00167CA369|nr:hypothetical protein [Streptomyces umbrinus]MCR3725319.1 hypothetical protein [Streptomyces umbrinus]GHH45193.1 hypothetical protein GCM10018775_34240 [Streptomyces umbrinus]
MIEYDPGSGLPPDPVEQRLRDALRARTDSVGLSDLRPAAPPSGRARFRLAVSRPVRRAVLLLVLAAVVVGVLFASARWEGPRQAPPANGPSAPPTPTTPGAVTASPDGGRP